ncbi:MAG TPA: hypothetical protein VD966_01625 [Pyrinomonadaceae bacterium]|nr:hypothetical protein [Pyrinomonadaceae bacterium]
MRRIDASLLVALVIFVCACTGCRRDLERPSVRPRSLRDVPAQRLAYRFEADTAAPEGAPDDEPNKLASVQADFDSRRKDDALLRTVLSPDSQRVLALYETGDVHRGEFRIDMYAADGTFLRNVTPPELSGAFAQTVSWSPDGNQIAFIGRKSLTPAPTPTPLDAVPEVLPEIPIPSPSIAPIFAPVPVFSTEQIYICNRDGFELKPLTTREGLIYFHLAWAPDGHALVALACLENEWSAREEEFRLPVGRPRLIRLDGRERLLDDELTEALPVWSPDSAKVATAFDTQVGIYDAATETPTGARIPLHAPLLAASIAYDEKNLKKKAANAGGQTNGGAKSEPQTGSPPISFNPIIRLLWPQPETLFLQTAYVRTYPNDPVNSFPRWHTLHLSPQAALLSGKTINVKRSHEHLSQLAEPEPQSCRNCSQMRPKPDKNDL